MDAGTDRRLVALLRRIRTDSVDAAEQIEQLRAETAARLAELQRLFDRIQQQLDEFAARLRHVGHDASVELAEGVVPQDPGPSVDSQERLSAVRGWTGPVIRLKVSLRESDEFRESLTLRGQPEGVSIETSLPRGSRSIEVGDSDLSEAGVEAVAIEFLERWAAAAAPRR